MKIDMWNEITEMKDLDGKPCFLNISQLAKSVHYLPHSNAEAERIFPIVTDVKTKIRYSIVLRLELCLSN